MSVGPDEQRPRRRKSQTPSTKDAEHILFMLTGFEAFDTLLTERGLSRDKAVDLLINTAEQALYSE